MSRAWASILWILMRVLRRRWSKEVEIGLLLLLKWMLLLQGLILLSLLNSNKSLHKMERKEKSYQSFIWSIWQVVKKLVKLVQQEIVSRKQQVLIKVYLFWVWSFLLWLINPQVKTKTSLYLIEILALLVSCKMLWEVTVRLLWFVPFLQPQIITKKLCQLWDMLIKQRRFKTKQWLMSHRLINLFEFWLKKDNSSKIRFKRCKKCSRNFLWEESHLKC